GTLKSIENCTSCKDNIKSQYSYYSEIYKSIREIESYLVELEKGEKEEQEKVGMIYKLSNKLIKVDVEINRNILCRVCGRNKSINKLINLLNELINRSDLTVRITDLSNEFLETLKS